MGPRMFHEADPLSPQGREDLLGNLDLSVITAGCPLPCLSLVASVAKENDTHQEGSFGGICSTLHTLKLPVVPTVVFWFAHLGLAGLGVPEGIMIKDRAWKYCLEIKCIEVCKTLVSHGKC